MFKTKPEHVELNLDGPTATLNVQFLLSFVVRGLGALIGFAHGLLVARATDIGSAGIYFLAYNFMLVLSTVGGLGLNTLMVKVFATTNERRTLYQLIVTSIIYNVISCLLIATLFYYVSPQIERYTNKPGFAALLISTCLSILATSLLNIACGALQGLHRTSLMVIFQNILPFVGVFGLIAVRKMGGEAASAKELMNALTGGLILSFVFALLCLVRHTGLHRINVTYSFRLEQFGSFWIIQVAQLCLFGGVIVLCSRFMSSADIAVLYLAQRVSAVITFLLITVTLVATPRIAAAYHSGNLVMFRRITHQTSRFVFLSGLPIVIVSLFFSERMLSIFGPAYNGYGYVLQILAVAHFFVLLCGPVGAIMTMTGMEDVLSKINVLLIIPLVPLSVYMCFRWGLIGVVLGLAFVMFFQNYIAVVAIKRRFNFYPLLG